MVPIELGGPTGEDFHGMVAIASIRWLLGCVIASYLVGVAAPIQVRAEESPEGETAGSRRLHAISICEQTVAGELERAGNLNWPDHDRYRVQERAGTYEVSGYVDTQSPLGDVRKTWTCHATGVSGRWSASAMLGGEEKAPGSPGSASASAPTSSPATALPPSMPAEPSAPARVGRCPSAQFRDTYSERYTERGYQIVKGKIENSGALPIRNVKVCASGTCAVVHDEPPLASGSSKEFAIQVPSLETVTVTAQCSVVAPM